MDDNSRKSKKDTVKGSTSTTYIKKRDEQAKAAEARIKAKAFETGTQQPKQESTQDIKSSESIKKPTSVSSNNDIVKRVKENMKIAGYEQYEYLEYLLNQSKIQVDKIKDLLTSYKFNDTASLSYLFLEVTNAIIPKEKLIEILLNEPSIDANIVNYEGFTPLYLIIRRNPRNKALELMINSDKVDINYKYDNKITVNYYDSQKRHKILKLLPPLCIAVAYNNEKALKLLLESEKLDIKIPIITAKGEKIDILSWILSPRYADMSVSIKPETRTLFKYRDMIKEKAKEKGIKLYRENIHSTETFYDVSSCKIFNLSIIQNDINKSIDMIKKDTERKIDPYNTYYKIIDDDDDDDDDEQIILEHVAVMRIIANNINNIRNIDKYIELIKVITKHSDFVSVKPPFDDLSDSELPNDLETPTIMHYLIKLLKPNNPGVSIKAKKMVPDIIKNVINSKYIDTAYVNLHDDTFSGSALHVCLRKYKKYIKNNELNEIYYKIIYILINSDKININDIDKNGKTCLHYLIDAYGDADENTKKRIYSLIVYLIKVKKIVLNRYKYYNYIMTDRGILLTTDHSPIIKINTKSWEYENFSYEDIRFINTIEPILMNIMLNSLDNSETSYKKILDLVLENYNDINFIKDGKPHIHYIIDYLEEIISSKKNYQNEKTIQDIVYKIGYLTNKINYKAETKNYLRPILYILQKLSDKHNSKEVRMYYNRLYQMFANIDKEGAEMIGMPMFGGKK